MRRLFAVSLVMWLFLSACGSGNKVGDGLLDKVGEGKGGPRLGEKSPAAKDLPTPVSEATKPPTAPTNEKTPAAAPSKQVIHIFLISAGPYYQIEGQSPGADMTVPTGVIVRWVNKETDKIRQPFSRDLFDCARLEPGETCDFTVNVRGTVDIEDRAKPFATGRLEMQ